MSWYIALKDIINFYKTEKSVFVRLILSMVICSFVMNYSYSFARYRGNLYDESMGVDIPVYKIYSHENLYFDEFENILSDFKNVNLPDVTKISCMSNTNDGIRIAGSTDISPKDFNLTGAWTEGYSTALEGSNICAVNADLLSYDESHIKMTGEKYKIDNEDYIIGGVYESLGGAADIIISIDKYKEKYGYFDEIWITFAKNPNKDEQKKMEDIIKKYVASGTIYSPEISSNAGEMITLSNQFQYSIFIVLLIVFLASLIQYWYDANIATYTIYQITGASVKKILRIVFSETFLLSTVCYLGGLLLNALVRLIFTENAALTANDIILGFSIFWGTMLLLCLANMIRVCRTFSINNIWSE